jgi:protein ImuB
LLPSPVALEVRGGTPWLEGALTLEPDRERIESGWWDDGDVRRDYFVARTRTGARLWVYRELTDSCCWFLHGVFG